MSPSRAELEEQRQFLLDSLRDLEKEHEAGEIADDDYESLRDDYTARAAEVLRALEEAERGTPPARPPTRRPAPRPAGRRPAGPAPAPAPAAPPPRRSSKFVAWALIVAFLLVASMGVLLFASGRNPGSPATGSAPQTDAERLQQAHQLESQGKAVDALKLYDAVLKNNPNDVEALTYRGWLLKLAGLTDQAQTTLEKALSIDPTYPDAHFFRGMLLFQDRKDPASAIPELETYLKSNPAPQVVSAVQGVLDQARAAVATTTTTTGP